MIVLLLFLLPLIGGLVCFLLKDERTVKSVSLLVTIVTLALTLAGIRSGSGQTTFSAQWMGSLGSSFSLKLDGLGGILCLLNAIAYPLIFVSTWNSSYRKTNNFYGLMLLTQAGMMGVFLATDALLFYFFWELALIPVYFLCSGWGGEKRIPVTFKFFIYTFTGSVLMLIGLLFLYFHTPDHTFSLDAFYNLKLSIKEQYLAFWLLFIAFAVKMPVFPLHTWQPDTYEQSPTAVTMVLSALMVKMGLYGVIRWVLPVVPAAAFSYGDFVMWFSLIGIVYASLIAMRQNDVKRLVAYSSIAHMGLMAATLFAETNIGYQGVMIQMFNHGVNILGLWIVIEIIERRYGTRKLSELGGLAKKAPGLTILLVIIALANISLPLTNSFIGEFMMFTGIWTSEVTDYNHVFTVIATIGIILSAVYTLTMIQKIFFGATSQLTENGTDIRINERLALGIIVLLIFVFGVYPQPMLDLTKNFTEGLLQKVMLPHTAIK